MRKKMIIISMLILLVPAAGLAALTKGQDTRFDGDRISGPDCFNLRFERMNMTDSETILLQEGDLLHVSWQIEEGSMDMQIGQTGQEAIYRASDRPAGDRADFYVKIPGTGSYTITVSARKAKGKIDISRE